MASDLGEIKVISYKGIVDRMRKKRSAREWQEYFYNKTRTTDYARVSARVEMEIREEGSMLVPKGSIQVSLRTDA